MKVKLLTYTPNPDKIVSMAGKLCYSPIGIDELEENLTQEQIDKFVNMLINLGHESPIEHVSFTFAIEGVSRVLEQQLTRHRVASYSIQSGRYVKRENPDFYIPNDIKNNDEALKIYLETCDICADAYNKIFNMLLHNYLKEFYKKTYPIKKEDDRLYQDYLNDLLNSDLINEIQKKNIKHRISSFEKKACENARYIFPNSLETKIIFTMNARELLHFSSKRCCNRSQEEIRELAHEMLKQLKEVAPLLFKNAGANCLRGKCPEGAMSCGNPYKKEIDND